jgi:hypothetical protein
MSQRFAVNKPHCLSPFLKDKLTKHPPHFNRFLKSTRVVDMRCELYTSTVVPFRKGDAEEIPFFRPLYPTFCLFLHFFSFKSLLSWSSRVDVQTFDCLTISFNYVNIYLVSHLVQDWNESWERMLSVKL